MDSFEVGNVELTRLAHDLSAASGQPFKDVVVSLVADAALQVETLARAYAPVDTGLLRDSIRTEIAPDGMSATVSVPVSYAGYVEFGTGPRGEFGGHPIVITPKRAKFLRFEVQGRVVYTKKVVSMGMAPRPFLRPALERLQLPLAQNMANAAVVSIVKGPQAPETLSNAPATSPYRSAV